MPCLTPLDAGLVQAVVQRLDEQILECVEDEQLAAHQQTELLTWLHNHLLSAYVAIQLDKHPGPAAQPVPKRFILPCCTVVDMISEMLQGGVPLGEDRTFQCPPSSCPRALALSRKLPAWLRGRVVLTAQRTRLHAEAELTALWQTIEAHLITGALVWFDLADLLDVDVPPTATLNAITRGCLDAARGKRGMVWTPARAIFQAL